MFCEHEGLGFISSTHIKRSGVIEHTCNPNAGRYRQTDPSLTYSVVSRPLRLYFKRQVGWLPRVSSDFYTNVHTHSWVPVSKQAHLTHTKKISVLLIGCGFQTLLCQPSAAFSEEPQALCRLPSPVGRRLQGGTACHIRLRLP